MQFFIFKNMNHKILNIQNINIGNTLPFVLFGGINVLESYDLAMRSCEYYVNVTEKLKIPYVFKASFDKANRSSFNGYRGPGIEKGIKIFKALKKTFGVKLLTDVHEIYQVKPISEIVDVIQLPAFLARQTDLIKTIAKTNCVVNVKKPQFMSPTQILFVVEKFSKNGNDKIIICDRGTMFGYDNLIVDILGFNVMKKITNGNPIILDVTHSLQFRNSFDRISNGRKKQISELSRAGIAVGLSGIFLESHFNPDVAKCDGASALPIHKLYNLLQQIKEIDNLIKSFY